MAKKWVLAVLILATIALGGIVAFWQTRPQADAFASQDLSPFEMLGALTDENGFARVEVSRDFRFPDDHAAHGDHRTEWWYLSGTLEQGDRARIGLQLALIRLALVAKPPEHPSRWAASEIYAGFLSVSDPAGDGVREDRRMTRAALGLAGTHVHPVRVWVEDWTLEQLTPGEQALDLAMRIAADDLELDLTLQNIQPLIDASEIRAQGSQPAAPVHFYIQPRLRAEGTLLVAGQSTALSGTLAFEHAWGELPLPGGPVARDRFTLHLDDQRALFCIRTHRVDGTGTPTTTALLVGPDAPARALSSGEIELQPTGFWTSQRTEIRYPVSWSLRIPAEALELELSPYRQDQEGVTWEPFWAGPVRLRAGAATAGHGFVHLNGYAGS